MTEVVLPGVISAVPLLGAATAVTERAAPKSGSMSLATTSTSTAVSTAVVPVSSIAVGAVFVGVTVTDALAGPAPMLFVARIRNLYSSSLVRPVTVWKAAFVPPASLLGIPIQSETSYT